MKKRILRVLLPAFFAILLLTSASDAAEAPIRAVVFFEEDASPAAVEAALAELPEVSLLWRYGSLFSGAAVEAGPAGLQALEALEGVAGVSPVRQYAPASAGGEDAELWSDAGLALMGAGDLWREGVTGDGTVIAVLDSGFNTAHEAFADASLTRSPAVGREDIAAYAQKGTAGRYVSERIPFAYDYCHRDGDVSAASGHGTHVAALAAGYARREDGTVRIRGGAPGAQILAMKIFPDEPGGGADDAVILRALEDAWNLGADVINLSVGTGPGFSRDGALDGAYYRAFALLASEGVVVCCSAGNEESAAVYKTWTRPLPSGAYPDYGSVTAPASFRGAAAIASAGEEEGRAVMADYSSWGPASGLHLAPALTAFGGPVVSAGAGGPEAYCGDYGTSMACGYASGLFAAALQALEERGAADRKEAARLAQALLESTARTLTDEGGAPLSPRKQGAGLMDLDAALASPAAFLNPLAELGGREDGRFTLRYTLKNLSDQAADYALTVRVLTDAYTEDGGTAYSLMSPLDITEGVSVAGPASVSVPAGGEAEIVFELAVRDRLRRELAEAYPNGFYVEGYVTAAGPESGQAVHGTFLGFCGDWEAAPVLEAADFRDLQDESFRLAGEGHGPAGYNPLQVPEPCLEGLGAELGANLAYLPAKGTADSWYGRLLGANGHAAGACSEARFAIPGWGSDGMHSLDRRLCLALYALRNAAGIAAVVSDGETGEIYYAAAETWAGKSTLDIRAARIGPSALFAWDGRDARGRALPGGTRARVDVYAWLDGGNAIREAFDRDVRRQDPSSFRCLLEERYDGWRVMSFPVTIDSEAPAVVSAALDPEGVLTLTVRDNEYLAYAAVTDEKGTVLVEEAFFPQEAGAEGTLKADLSGLASPPETLYVTVEDYASHITGYVLTLPPPGEDGPPSCRPSARSVLRDANPSAWYWEAVDRAVCEGWMACSRERLFQPDRAAVRSEIVSALYQAAGRPAPRMSAGELPFTDLAELPEDLDALCWAYENELVSGRSDGTFGGGAGVTRQELAVMLYRWARLSGETAPAGGLDAFSDAGTISGWAEEGAAWAAGRGLLQGSGGQLRPRAGVTRAETAQVLLRLLEGRRDG